MATKEIKNLKWFFKVFGKKRKLQNFHFIKTNARKVFSPSALRIKLLKLTIIKSATKVSDNTVQVSYPVRTCLKNFLEELTDPNPTPSAYFHKPFQPGYEFIVRAPISDSYGM